MTPAGYAPPRSAVGPHLVVAAEVVSVAGQLTFDVQSRRASADVTMVFTAGPESVPTTPHAQVPSAGAGGAVPTSPTADGVYAAFDLRQALQASHLDGRALPSSALAHVDLGGGTGAAMRLVGPLTPGSRHTLSLRYDLATPNVAKPLAVAWTGGGVRFDVWCSDLHPGRYLEQWLPVGLCQDRFSLALDVEIRGAGAEHRIVANAQIDRTADHIWHLTWPASHTSLSSLLVLAPAAEFDVATAVARTGRHGAGAVRAGDVTVEATVSLNAGGGASAGRGGGPGRGSRADTAAEFARAAEVAERVSGWLEENTTVVGPYIHGSRFVAHAWAHDRGMEYDGATSCSVSALEHEVFHSWFGRGVKPGSANDGWIDEAYTTWCTSSRPDMPRLAAVPLPLDLAPVVLDPRHPWSRHTPIESYRTGYRLFAGLASAAGAPTPDGGGNGPGAPLAAGAGAAPTAGAERVRDAMAAYYRARAGGFMTTDSLQAHLSEALSIDVAPWWDRYVRGLG